MSCPRNGPRPRSSSHYSSQAQPVRTWQTSARLMHVFPQGCPWTSILQQVGVWRTAARALIGVPEVTPAECDARAPQSNRSNPPQGAQLHSLRGNISRAARTKGLPSSRGEGPGDDYQKGFAPGSCASAAAPTVPSRSRVRIMARPLGAWAACRRVSRRSGSSGRSLMSLAM